MSRRTPILLCLYVLLLGSLEAQAQSYLQLFEQAKASYNRGDYRQAATLAKSAIHSAKASGAPKETVLSIRDLLARSYYKDKQLTNAIEQYKILSKAVPSNQQYPQTLATIQSQYQKAVRLKQVEHDVGVLAQLGPYIRDWNSAAAPLVKDLMDPMVDASTWVYSSGPQLNELRGALLGMRSQVSLMQHPQFRSVFGRLVQNYSQKLAALTALRDAMSNGDEYGQNAAIAALERAVQGSRPIQQEVMGLLRPYLNEAEFSEGLRERIRALTQYMNS